MYKFSTIFCVPLCLSISLESMSRQLKLTLINKPLSEKEVREIPITISPSLFYQRQRKHPNDILWDNSLLDCLQKFKLINHGHQVYMRKKRSTKLLRDFSDYVHSHLNRFKRVVCHFENYLKAYNSSDYALLLQALEVMSRTGAAATYKMSTDASLQCATGHRSWTIAFFPIYINDIADFLEETEYFILR